MLHISTVRKLDGIPSWSLPAGRTCPGSVLSGGAISPVCLGCYAKGGNYRFNNVRHAREDNMRDWRRPGWVRDMVLRLSGEKFFRWFDSGDCYTVELALKILEVVRRTPGCRHWMSTRMHKIPRVYQVLRVLDTQPNCVIRYSADTLDGTYTLGLHKALVLPPDVSPDPQVFACPAPEHPDGKCHGCRACWCKGVSVVGYTTHGAGIVRVLRSLGREVAAQAAEKHNRQVALNYK